MGGPEPRQTDPSLRAVFVAFTPEARGHAFALPPFFAKPSGNNKRTVSVIPKATWTKTVGRAPSQPLEWAHVHHLIGATMLTHALAQGDF